MSTSTQHIAVLKSNDSHNSNHPVNVHANPSVQASVKITLAPGTRVEVVDQSQPGDGHTWYKINYGQSANNLGWVRNDVIDILPDQNPPDVNTRLYFETDTHQVRVFGEGQLSMNVYNKQDNTTEVDQAPVVKVPSSDDQSQTFLAQTDGRSYQAKFVPRGNTELVISSSNDGHVINSEAGFSANGIDYRNA